MIADIGVLKREGYDVRPLYAMAAAEVAHLYDCARGDAEKHVYGSLLNQYLRQAGLPAYKQSEGYTSERKKK